MPALQIRAMQDLIAEGVALGRISSNYKLIGHRQAINTECPGDKLYEEIKTWPHYVATPTYEDLLDGKFEEIENHIHPWIVKKKCNEIKNSYYEMFYSEFWLPWLMYAKQDSKRVPHQFYSISPSLMVSQKHHILDMSWGETLYYDIANRNAAEYRFGNLHAVNTPRIRRVNT